MKKLRKIALGVFMLMITFSLIGTVDVNATGEPDQIIEVNGDSIQTQLQSNLATRIQFRELTRLTICANVNIELDINCEALRIAQKEFVLELEAEKNLRMTMTCTREEIQLGLIKGNTYRVRNRNTYRYQEGFCIALECVCGCQCQNECQCICDCECQCQNECQCICDCGCQCQNECQCVCNCEDNNCFTQARLRIRLTNQNRLGNWAYYDVNNKEWVIVPTTIEDGYLTTTTNHFSTWTVLIPTNTINNAALIGSSAAFVLIGVIIGISVIYFKKRR